jgi:hypothetical protein
LMISTIVSFPRADFSTLFIIKIMRDSVIIEA